MRDSYWDGSWRTCGRRGEVIVACTFGGAGVVRIGVECPFVAGLYDGVWV